VYIPTEFCYEVALPDNFTSDAKKMRELDQYKIKNPDERFDKIKKVLERVFNAPEFDQFSILLQQ
jgi:hypothetical protein